MAKTAKKNMKPSKRIVDPDRRHMYGQGGRNPLSDVANVPVGCVLSKATLCETERRSLEFIKPTTFRPYGRTSLIRVLVEIESFRLGYYSEDQILAYVDENREDSVGGRVSIGASPRKVSLLITENAVRRINDYVIEMDNPLIGTSTVVRFLIDKGIINCNIEALYGYISNDHKTVMIVNGLTISDLQRNFRNAK